MIGKQTNFLKKSDDILFSSLIKFVYFKYHIFEGKRFHCVFSWFYENHESF